MSALLRPLLALLTFLTVLLALTTLVGRASMAVLHRFEAQINLVAAHYGAEVGGLRGEWHYLNPILRMDSARFAGGALHGLQVEVDLVRSALHNSLVIRRLYLDELELALVQDSQGRWQMGPARDTPGDPAQLLARLKHFWHTLEDVRLHQVQIRLARQLPASDAVAPVAVLPLSLYLRHTDGRLQGRLQLASMDPACADCGLDLGYDLRQQPLRRHFSGDLWLLAEDFILPAALREALPLGGGHLQLAGHWQLQDQQAQGWLALSAQALGLKLGQLHAGYWYSAGTLDLRQQRLRLQRNQLLLATPEHEFATTNLQLEAQWQQRPTLQARATALDVAPLMHVITAAVAEHLVSRQWLENLAVAGTVTELQGQLQLQPLQLGYRAEVLQTQLDHYKGSPLVRDLRAQVLGTEQLIEVQLGQQDLTLGFLDIYDHPTRFDHVSGRLLFYIAPNYFSLRGDQLAVRLGETRARGSFALAQPRQPADQRLLLDIDVQQIAAAEALPLVPNKLPAPLLDWLDTAVLAGQVDRARVALHAHLNKDFRHRRQIAVDLRVRDATLAFHPDWPIASALSGRVLVDAAGTHATLEQGSIQGIELRAGQLFVPEDGSLLRLDAVGRGAGADALAFWHASPLATWVPAVDASWQAGGVLDMDVSMELPLRESEEPLQLAVTADLLDLDLHMRDLNLSLTRLRGGLQYRYPLQVQAVGVTGELFSQPVLLAATSTDLGMQLDFVGQVQAPLLWDWLRLPVAAWAQGELDYLASLYIPGNGQPPWLEVASDMWGLQLDLPEGLGKATAEAWPTRVEARWLPTTTADTTLQIDIQVEDLGEARVMLEGGELQSGLVRFGATQVLEPVAEPSRWPLRPGLWVTGQLPPIRLGSQGSQDWAFTAADPLAALPDLPLAFDGLVISELRHGDLVLPEFALSGSLSAQQLALQFAGTGLAGALEIAADARPWRINLEYLRLAPLPEDYAQRMGAGMSGLDQRALPAMDVRLNALHIGDADWGSWQFSLRQRDAALQVMDVDVQLRGLRLSADEGLFWYYQGGTSLIGEIRAGDLGEVLPQWGFAPSVETRSLYLHADLYWPADPWAPSLASLEGRVQLRMQDGRFIEMQTGAGTQRILSLLNLAKIARRITMDFSDVFGRGIAFDELHAHVQLLDGQMHFLQPMVIDGTGSAFRINGQVNLLNNDLNAEMIVTLPVSDSLPWYAAYLAVANPIAAGAVLVGERLFRAQIEQMSSAKYRINGTLDDPRVSFQRAFPTAMEAVAPPVAVGSRGGRQDQQAMALPLVADMVLVPVLPPTLEDPLLPDPPPDLLTPNTDPAIAPLAPKETP